MASVLLKNVRSVELLGHFSETPMIEEKKTVAKVTPKADNRWRVSKAVKLWVVNRGWSKDKTHLEVCGVLESVERSVYMFEGRNGQWVRYSNCYYPLHTAKEFSEFLVNAKKDKCEFWNNEIAPFGNAIKDTEPAPFIYCDEPGPLA